MKIIGVDGKGDYIAVISHSEVEKVVNKYYGKLDKLSAGDDIDLGVGHNFRVDIKKTCESMESAIKQFDAARKSMLQFAVMVASLPELMEEEK